MALPIVCSSMISCFRCSGSFFGEQTVRFLAPYYICYSVNFQRNIAFVGLSDCRIIGRTPFEVLQGDHRQGGILSTDLYKLYVNPLFDRLTSSNIGLKIGNVVCNTSACADDIALMSRNEVDMQIQTNVK